MQDQARSRWPERLITGLDSQKVRACLHSNQNVSRTQLGACRNCMMLQGTINWARLAFCCMQALYESQKHVAEAHFEAIDIEDVGLVSITRGPHSMPLHCALWCPLSTKIRAAEGSHCHQGAGCLGSNCSCCWTSSMTQMNSTELPVACTFLYLTTRWTATAGVLPEKCLSGKDWSCMRAVCRA